MDEKGGDEAAMKPDAKDSPEEDLKDKFLKYATDNLFRSTEELHKIVTASENLSLCQDIISLLHKVTFVFYTAEKNLKLKQMFPSTENEEFNLQEKKSELLSGQELKDDTFPAKDAVPLSCSPGINVAAPDFVPLSITQRTKVCVDQGTQTLGIHPFDSLRKIDEPFPDHRYYGELLPVNFDYNVYHDSANDYYNYHTSHNLFPYHTHFQSYSHYVPQLPHYQLSYATYSPEIRSQTVHVPPGFHQSSFHGQYQGRRNRWSGNSDSKQQSKISKPKKHNDSGPCLAKSEKNSSPHSESSPFIDSKKTKGDMNDNLVAIFSNENTTEPDGQLPQALEADSIESRIESNSDSETVKLVAESCLKDTTDSDNTSAEISICNIEVNKVKEDPIQALLVHTPSDCLAHFSEVPSLGSSAKEERIFSSESSQLGLSIKSLSNLMTQEQDKESYNSAITIPSTSLNQPDFLPTPAAINGSSHWNEGFPLLSSPGDGGNDSDGWEIVKTRSKWRDTADYRSSRHSSIRNPRTSVTRDAKHFDYQRRNPSFHSFGEKTDSSDSYRGSLLYKLRNEDHLSASISFSSTFLEWSAKKDESFDAEDHSFEQHTVKSDSLNESYSNERRSSNSTLDENNFSQSEETSPELGLHDDYVLIDPNEMYSTYMKYLNNVKEEEVFSGTPPTELVLHPEILNDLVQETENCLQHASLEEMTNFVNNDPVRALAFKKKLDSRIRHQEDVKNRNEAKQQLAHEKRLQFLHDKTAKFRGFVQKVEEVKAAQHQLALQRKKTLDLKLKKAEEKRKMHLNIIKRKAHDEEEKLKEIAFINELEAQNRRHDSLALRQEHEERLQCLVEERQRKLEEKAAKEAAVEERRKALEAERQEKLELLKEKRRRKEEFIDRKHQEKEQERLEIAREKAREREERLLARHTAQQATLEELQKKIQQKQEESARRHIESIELIRQKAIEIGLHRNTSDGGVPKYLNLYKPDLKGDNAHDKYKIYLKKRLKKIKSRMVLRGSNYIEATHRSRKELTSKEALLEKILTKLKKYEPHKIYLWESEDGNHVDHLLDEILLFLQEEPSLKTALKDMKAFLFFDSVISTFNFANHEKVSVLSLRCILKIITICDLSCLESVEVCLYFLLSNILATLLDSLRFSLQALESPRKSWDLIVEILLRFHALVIDELNGLPETMILSIPDFATRMKDLISYILCSGLVNRLIDLFRPSIIEEKFIYGSLIVPSILFFKRLLSSWFISDDLIAVLKSTDLLGTVPLLYEGVMKHISSGCPFPEYGMPIISLYLRLADLDLQLFQDILGAENIALLWRGIASGLMTYCVSKNDSSDLLNSVIKLVGYFAVHNLENQTLLQSGKQPTVLQQLVKLPFQYFCDPEFMQVLFPTLISCSFNNSTNRAIVESEIDYEGLEKFMHSEIGQKNKIIRLVLAEDERRNNPPENKSDSPKKNILVPD